VYNVGGGRGYTVREFARIVGDVIGVDLPPQETGEYRVGDTRHSISDIAKLRALGWAPTKTPRDSVSDYVSWLKAQHLDRDYAGEALSALRQLGALRKARPR
jgi:dTDP-L-rhamnose 4-epimerase